MNKVAVGIAGTRTMKLEMLKAKLHQARITHAQVKYEGSRGIDVELMEAVGLYQYEKVLVAKYAGELPDKDENNPLRLCMD